MAHRYRWHAVWPARRRLPGNSQPLLKPVFLLLACCTQEVAKPPASAAGFVLDHAADAIERDEYDDRLSKLERAAEKLTNESEDDVVSYRGELTK